MRSKNRKITLLVLLCLLFAGVLFVNGKNREVTAGTSDVYENLEVFTEVLKEIQENYVDIKEAEELIQGAIKGMVESLHPHSSYMTKKEYEDFSFGKGDKVIINGSDTGWIVDKVEGNSLTIKKGNRTKTFSE